MNKYESVIIINPNLEAEAIKALIEKYETEENLVRILLTNVEPKEN